MQKSMNSITNIYDSDGEETFEETKNGDKTLSHYKRKSVSRSNSTPSGDYPPLKKDLREDIQIQRSSIVKSHVTYEHAYWKSDDYLVPPPPFHPTTQHNEQPITKSDVIQQKTREFDPHTYSHKSPCNVPSHRMNHFPQHSYQTDRFNDKFSHLEFRKSNSIDTQFQTDFLQPEMNQHDSSLNSSKQSDDSSSKIYLDLSGDRYDQSIIDHLNIVTLRKESAANISAGSSVSKYSSNVNRRSPNTQNCRSPDSINFPFDTSELNNIQQANDQISRNLRTEYVDISNDIIIRRIQICKYVAIFFIAITAIVCLLFGILHFYVGYYPQMLYLNEGDAKLISASSSFCSGVIAVSRTSNLRVITFKKKSKSKSTENTITGNLNIVPSAVWKRDFYLQHGSSVSMKIKSIYALDIFIFVSRKRFLIWFQRKQSDTYLKKISCCAGTKEKQKTIMFTSTMNERYYIAIHNQIEVIPVAVYLELTFMRISYDFTDTTHHCLTTVGKPCSVEYTFNNGEDAALEVPLSKDASKIPQSSEVEWKCIARVWFYVVLFLVAFIVISTGIFTSYYVTVTICIPSKQYCCAIYEDNEKNKSSEFLYHNKYIKDGAESSDRIVDSSVGGKSLKNIRTPDLLVASSVTNKTPFYKLQSSPSRSNRPAVSKQSHHAIAHTKQILNIEPNIATIYERNRFIGDAEGSGMSLDPGFTPTRQSYKQDMMQLQELQIQQLKTLRTNQQPRKFVIADGPCVNQLIRRPKSDIFPGENYNYEPNYGYGPTSTMSIDRHNYDKRQNLRMSSTDNYGYEPTSTMPAIRGNYPYNQLNRLRNIPNNINDTHSQIRDFIQNDVIHVSTNSYDVSEFEVNELSSDRPNSRTPDDELYQYTVSNPVRRRPDSIDQEMYI